MPWKHNPTEQRLLAAHGEGLGAYLRRLYVDEGKTFKDLMPILGTTSARSIGLILNKYGVPIRRGAEAVAHQWKRKPERRERAAEQMGRLSRERAAAGLAWCKGHTKETHPSIASTAQKLAERRWLLRPDSIAKANETKKRRHREDPSTHTQAHAAPSRTEALFAAWLERTGRAYEFQKPLQVGDDLFFIDFYLPRANLAIELTQDRGRVPPARLRAFRGAGLLPMAILNYPILHGHFAHIEEVIARAERGEFHPTTVGECWVCRSPGQLSAARQREAQEPLGGGAGEGLDHGPEAQPVRQDEIPAA